MHICVCNKNNKIIKLIKLIHYKNNTQNNIYKQTNTNKHKQTQTNTNKHKQTQTNTNKQNTNRDTNSICSTQILSTKRHHLHTKLKPWKGRKISACCVLLQELLMKMLLLKLFSKIGSFHIDMGLGVGLIKVSFSYGLSLNVKGIEDRFFLYLLENYLEWV